MKKILWMLLSCLMVFSLVLASCGDETAEKTTTEDDTEDTVKITESETSVGTDTGDE